MSNDVNLLYRIDEMIREYIDDEEVYQPYIEALEKAIEKMEGRETVDEYINECAKDIIEIIKDNKFKGEEREEYIDQLSADTGDFIGTEIADQVRIMMEE